MASRSSLRQVSQIVRNNRSHLLPSRTQHYSSQPLCRAPATSRIRSLPSRSSIHYVQQTRNLSLWGSSSSKAPNPADVSSTSNVNIIEPSQFESLRTIKANDTNSDFSHTPNPTEPAFLEDIQEAIAQPHGVEPPNVPLEEIPERVGYLYEVCGIDFGYGPSSMMQWIFEHIHIWGDLSWSASIVVMSVMLRGLLVPFIIMSAKEGATLKLMSAAAKPVQQKVTEAKERGDMQKVQEYTMEMRAIAKSYNVKWSRLIAPMALQFPLGFGAWRNLRNCATLPVPGFVTESWLWNVDLTFSDTYLVVPAASAVLIWASLRVNTKVSAATGTGMANQDAMKILKTLLPVVSFAFMVFQPGAVQIYFLVSSGMGFLTTYFMSLNVVRETFGLVAVAPAPSPAAVAEAMTPAGPAPKPVSQAFMQRRRTNIIDVPAREVPTNYEAATQAAADQNMSSLDKMVNNVKKTFKGAFAGVQTNAAKAVGNKNKNDKNAEIEEARSRREQEDERRRVNERSGSQTEKRRRY